MSQLDFKLSLTFPFSGLFLLSTVYFSIPFPRGLGDAGEQLLCFAPGLGCVSVQVLRF